VGVYEDVAVVEPSGELATEDFEVFARSDGERLRRALVARFGVAMGNDVTDDALAYAWERWVSVGAMANPVGYLFRVGQSRARRYRRWQRYVAFPGEEVTPSPTIEPGLGAALARLPARQRVAVVLVHGFSWTYRQVADLLDVTESVVRNDVHRGLRRLRQSLGVNDDG
jgi:RNA polymerase sigma factor (sigma-70 family)